MSARAIRDLIANVILIYMWLIFLRALLSWFPQRRGGSLATVNDLLYRVTEPYIALFRRFLPVLRSGSVGVDLSMVVALVVLFILQQLIR
jgi:YggT family protein